MKKPPTLLLLFTLLPTIALATAGSASAAPTCTIDAKGQVAITSCTTIMGTGSQETCESLYCSFNAEDRPWYNQPPQQFSKKVFGGNQNEIFGERYTYAQVNWIINSLFISVNPVNSLDFEGFLNLINTINTKLQSTASGAPLQLQDYAQLGPAGIFAWGISSLYDNPPASGIQEVKTTASRLLNPATPAYAQGFGYLGLSNNNTGGAVRALWTATSNMSYAIIAILFIVSGFMIMFRVKINPQTVISLQTLIPKLIMTMLLITFSFAIGGFVIDLIYVFLSAITGFLSIGLNPIVTNSTAFYTWISGGSSVSPFGEYVIKQLLWFVVGYTTLIFTSFVWLIGLIPGFGVGTWVVILIIGLIWLIHFLWTLFKIFKTLLTSYVNLVLRIAFGPVQIMLDLIPGQQGFQPWLMTIISEASVFVVVPLMIYLQYFFSGTSVFGHDIIASKDWVTLGGLNDLSLPFFGRKLQGGSGFFSFPIRFLVSYFIFALTPKMADIVKEALKVPIFKYGNILDQESAQVVNNLMTYQKLAKDNPSPLLPEIGSVYRGTTESVRGLRDRLRPPTGGGVRT